MFSAAPAWCLWQTFGILDGLPQLRAAAIAQDSSENLWFATTSGASRYDGATFRTFQASDGLPNNDVHSVYTDRTGRVWFATQEGVGVLDHGTWTTLTTVDGLASDEVRAILQDHLGRLWFATAQGASRYDGTSWRTFTQADGLPINSLSCVYEDHAGNLWFGTAGSGLSRFDGTTWTSYSAENTGRGLPGNQIACIRETRDGSLWVGTLFGGLGRLQGTTWTAVDTVGGIALSSVTSLSEDSRGVLWLGSDGGVARYDGRTWRSYTRSDGLAGNFVSALIHDVNGNLWVATDAGVSRYDGESWTTRTDAGLGSFATTSLLEDPRAELWAALDGGGIAHFGHDVWTPLTVASTSGGLASNRVSSIVQDSTGALWCATNAGASRLADGVWRTFTPGDGLAGLTVMALARDSSGDVWFGTSAGLGRYDGATWAVFTNANGLPNNFVRSLCVDRAGRLWCGTSGGVGVFEGGAWTRYTIADGLAGSAVTAVLQDHSGAMWFGTLNGLSRFDGSTWTTYRAADGLAGNQVLSLAETPDSVLWVGLGAGSGLSRFDGQLWQSYTVQDGLPDANIHAALAEPSGFLWFGTEGGVVLYEPARVPPQTVITSPAPPLSSSRLQTVHFAAAFRQILGIEFSTSLDAGPWSAWTPEDTWIGRDLTDGVHTLRVAARDLLHHVDPTPASSTFEVAATPPVPLITAPVFRQPVRDTLTVTGTAAAARFRSLRVDVRPAGATSWDPPAATTLVTSTTPVVNGVLAKLGTRALPDGDYELRLAVQDTLGLTGVTQVTFIVDNVAPFAVQTSPALVSALDGGDVFTTNREAHVYIPPRGLPRDATVHVDPLDPAGVPLALPDGATRLAPGFSLSTLGPAGEGVPLEKTAVFDLAVGGLSAPPGKRLAIYSTTDGATWTRLGGTLDASGARLSTPFSTAGSYAVFAASDVPVGDPIRLSLTPRVFSSRGAFASSTVQIGFVLAKAATVRVSIHNRAGRLVRVVTSGRSLGPGTNLVSWDGKDEDRHDVDSGLYLVSVEALGETHTQTLAVVR